MAAEKGPYTLLVTCDDPIYYIFGVITYSKSMINRVRLAILIVISSTGKIDIFLSAFAPENLVSETGSAVPSRVSLLISILIRLNLMLTYGTIPQFRGRVHLFISTAIRQRVSPEFIGSRNCVSMAFAAESPPTQSQ